MGLAALSTCAGGGHVDARRDGSLDLRFGPAHPDDRAGAVFRAPGHPVQRIPPHPRAPRARAHGRSGDLSVRPRRDHAGTAGLPLPAAAVRLERPHRSVAGQSAARPVAGGLGAAARAGHALRRRALARGGRGHRAGPGGDAGRAAPLRHALEPAAAARQLQVQPIARAAVGLRGLRAAGRAALARRDRDLRGARAPGARDRAAGGAGADRERARRRRRQPRRRARGRARGVRARADHAGGALHRHLRGVSGARSAV